MRKRKFYFSAKIQQEHTNTIRKMAIDIGVPDSNIVLKPEGCGILYMGIYIKFKNKKSYKKFKKLQLPGIVEVW